MTSVIPTSKPVLKLSKVFAKVDSLSYGPFTVKAKHANARTAKFFADEHEIPMQKSLRRIATLMIAKQGQPLTCEAYTKALDNPKENILYLQSSISKIRTAIDEGLRAKLPEDEKSLQRIEKLKECFASVNPRHIYGEKGKTMGGDMRGAYKISLDAL